MRLVNQWFLVLFITMGLLTSVGFCPRCDAAAITVKQSIDEKTVFPTTLAAIQSNQLFSTFLMVLKRSGLDKLLAQPSPMTVIVPTNIAFSTLPKPVFIQLLTKAGPLKSALQYLMIKGDVIHPVNLLGQPLQFHYQHFTINNGIKPIGIMKAKNGSLIITNQFVLAKSFVK